MSWVSGMPLYWRVCLINGAVFVAGTLALVLFPVTVSARVLLSEAAVLVVGLAAVLVLNSLLLRRSLAPLDRLIRTMEHADLRRPDDRLPEQGSGPVAQLIRAFNAMLSRLAAERRSSNARALAAQEAERHRIAQELHDEVGQSLTAVLLGLKRIGDRAPHELAADIDTVLETARGGLSEVGRVARRLRPGVLDDLGLRSALAALATDLGTHGAHVRPGIAPGLPRLEPQQELVIYRVAQEALTNVARHAGAGTVELTLSRQGEAVALRVADDGRGLRGQPEGTGILGMRERAQLVDGTLTVGSRVGGGTEVRLVVPL